MPADYPMLPLDQPYAGADWAPITAASDGETLTPEAYLNIDDRGLGLAANSKTSFTLDQAAQQLLGDRGWTSLGRAITVTYGFRSTEPGTFPDGVTGFSRFGAGQISQAELALQSWSDVANIRFLRVGSGVSGETAYSNSATILFSNYSTGAEGASAFAYGPGDTRVSSLSGDVWVNISLDQNQSPVTGTSGGTTLVHEIGHAIGLSHPGDYNASAGVEITYANSAEYYEDSRQYTVMSYFSSTSTGGNLGTRFPAAPQLDDIAAAQLRYGANYATRSDDTIYGFHSTAGREWYEATSSSSKVVFAVWDGGGADTLDFSGYVQSGTIDLREGYFSSVGGLVGNVAIARGAVIENARGGSGAEQIIGNASANALYGGGGNDVITGGAGAGFLRGEDGNDIIYGGQGFDDAHGNMGNDTVYGGAGDDWVVGGKDQDQLFGEDGGDIVLGNLGNDTLEGGAGDDVVRGGQGNDIVRGGDGADFVAGDLGVDVLTGGAGADHFHAFTGSGSDRVTDFTPGQDVVHLLQGQVWTWAQVGADFVVYMDRAGSADNLVLANVQLGALSPGWLIEG